jgi:hypothetical protein
VSSVVLLSVLTVLSAEPSRPKLERDLNWKPKPSDRAEIYEDNAPAFPSIESCHDFFVFVEAKDEVGMGQFYSSGVAVKLAKGTPVLVVQVTRPAPPVPVLIGRSMSPEERSHRFQADAFRSYAQQSQRKRGDYPLQVRVLDGTYKDQLRFVPEEFVAMMKEVPPPFVPPPPKPKPKQKVIAPAVRAATLLRSAQNLEYDNPDGALTLYRQIIADFPETPQAKTASARVKALGGK